MADVKEPFSTLDNGSGVGVTLRQIQAGDSTASKNGLLAFGFKDGSGNAVLPVLDGAGSVPVAFMDKPILFSTGELAAGSVGTLADVTGAEVTLTAAKIYSDLSCLVSCRSDSLFQVVHVDDSAGTPVEVVLAECVVGAGQYSFNMELKSFKLDTTGGTGVILLKVKAKNFELANSLRASIGVAESL
jgi:hypothetical protein